MIVDDSRTIRQQAGFTLEKGGFTVELACDGKEGLDKLAANPDIKFVICDINMPNLTGIEFLEELNKQGNQVPVVMLTTESTKEMINLAQELGAKGFMVKPFNPKDLIIAAEKFAK